MEHKTETTKELTPKETQKEILKAVTSTSKNVKIITWIFIISILITLYALAKLFGETGYFRVGL